MELTEHKDSDFSKKSGEPSVIRVRIFKRAMNEECVPEHYEDFQLESLGELAEQIENLFSWQSARTSAKILNKTEK